MIFFSCVKKGVIKSQAASGQGAPPGPLRSFSSNSAPGGKLLDKRSIGGCAALFCGGGSDVTARSITCGVCMRRKVRREVWIITHTKVVFPT